MSNASSPKLYRLTDKRVFGGVCAGIAERVGLPVAIVRVLAVIALFVGFFCITLIVYIAFWFILEPAPNGYVSDQHMGKQVSLLLNKIDSQLTEDEKKLRQLEHYVTSERFSLNSRFRQL